MNATEQFNDRIKETFKKLETIKKQLEEMQLEQKKQPDSYGFSGSIKYVNDELNDVIEFLNN